MVRICNTEAFWIKSLFGLVAIVSKRGDEGGATRYADEMVIRRTLNEVWTGTECGNEEAAALRCSSTYTSVSPSLPFPFLLSFSSFLPSVTSPLTITLLSFPPHNA